MRFSIVGPSAPLRGGIAQHTDRVVEALGTEHQVDLYPFSRQYPRWLFPGRSQQDPDVVSRSETRIAIDPYRRRTWKKVARDIAERCPDLVLIQWWHPWFSPVTRGLVAALRRELGDERRIAVICHNVLPHGAVPFQRMLARRGLGGAGRFIVHAEAEERRLRSLLSPPAGRDTTVHRMPLVCLAPEGVAPGRAEARRALGLGDEPTVLFFGLVREYKGVHDLIEALPHMAHTDAHLLVAGECYDPASGYEERAERLGVGERVTIQDAFVPDEEVATQFAASDVVALPYRAATQSAVLPLAIHYRRRFVVTDVGGLVEAAQGLAESVPPCSPEPLAAALDRALSAGSELSDGELERWESAEKAFTREGIRGAFEEVARAARGASAEGSTVVVAAHGDCPHLEATIGALVAQEGVPQPEVLVVYDGDGERLKERLAEFAARGVRVVIEPELGLNVKRNRGLLEATSECVLFTDDDCVPDPGWVHAMSSALERHSVVTGRVLALGEGVAASVRERAVPRTFRGPLALLLPWRAGCGNNLGVRRAYARALGGFDARIGVGTWSGAACDTEFLFRSLRARGGEVYYAPDAVVRHRQEPLGPTVLRKRRNYYRGMSFMARRIHPRSAAAWATAMLRVGGTAAARLWAGVRLDRSGWSVHGAEFRGAVEGFFPPKPPRTEGVGP